MLEKVIEAQHPLIVNFIDFRKAFDSIHRPALWKILKQYGAGYQRKSSPSSRNSMKRATVQSELTATEAAGSGWQREFAKGAFCRSCDGLGATQDDRYQWQLEASRGKEKPTSAT